MEEDIIPIDGLIAFAESDAGAKVFGGPEKAKGAAEHGREIKAAGAKYCDCPACAAVEAILSKKEELLGSRDNLEKFAREQYLMKKENEDIFIIVKE